MEAALKLRLERRADFKTLITLAEERGLVRPGAGDFMDTGRQIRNRFVHEGKQSPWTFGLADGVMRTSHILVAELYPDEPA